MQVNIIRTFALASLRFLRENSTASEKVYHFDKGT